MTEEKFYEIYYKYCQMVKKAVYNVLRDVDFSEDICQEVFLLFLEKADTLSENYYKQWFLVNARRKAIDFCRKSCQVHEITAAVPGEQNDVHQEDMLDWFDQVQEQGRYYDDEIIHGMILKELAERLLAELEKKNHEWYEIVVRMNIKGEGAEETARALGISVENLRTKRHRIKNWILENYRKEYEGA